MKKKSIAGRMPLSYSPWLKRLLIMKMIAILLLVVGLTSSYAESDAQTARLNLKFTKGTVKDVLEEIEHQTNLSFMYDNDKFKVDRQISIEAVNETLKSVVEKLISGENLKYEMVNRYIIITSAKEPPANQQGKKITGKVTDQTGASLPGVSVVVKGTTTGVITDNSGIYSLASIPENATLQFSFVGMKSQELIVGGKTTINVSLAEEAIGLDDVVVIGYGTRNRKDVTTAISTISSAKISNKVSLSPELAMQGQISGVQVLGNQGDPFSRQTIRIRGLNTWGVSTPLYVVDGIPIKEYGAGIEGLNNDQYNRGNINVMTMIDPNDIESISVLKDAAAAAIYGVRAGNGVILITTKKGKKEKTTVDYSTKFSIQNQYQHLNVLNTKDYAEHFTDFYTSNGLPILTNKALDAPFFDPNNPGYLGNNPTYDWQEAGKNKNAPTQEHSVRVSGGTDKTDYSVSFGYTNQEAVRLYNSLERYSGAINVNTEVNKYIRTGINLRMAYESGTQNTSLGTIADRAAYAPWQAIYDPNGINGYASSVQGFMPDGTWNTAVKYGSNTRENFLGTNSLSYNKNSGMRTMGTAYVEITPLKNLKLKGNISIDKFNNEIHNYSQYKRSVFTATASSPLAYPNSKGYYEERNTDNLNFIKEFTANYTNSFNKHNVDLMFNAMSQTYYAKIYKGYTYYMTTTDPNLFNFAPPLLPQDIGLTTTQNLGALSGLLLRTGYNYDHKYYLDLTARRDGSSRFSPETRWATFPGVSAAWRATEENFMKSISWLNDLKVRASWGSLGNQEVNDMAFLSTISGNSVYGWGTSADGKTPVTSGATVSGMANKILTWEKTNTMNVGMDFIVLTGLSGSFEYYEKNTNGILQTVTLPLSAGVLNNPVQNIGKVSNKGLELNLNYQGKINDDFQYSFGGNITTVKNRVDEMYKGIPMLGSGIEVGYPMFYIYGYQVGGMFQNRQEVVDFMATTTDVNYKGKETLINGGDLWFKDIRSAPVTDEEKIKGYSTTPDGKIDQYDQQMLGKTIPGYYYGLNFSCSYKGFDLSIQGMGVGDVQKINSIKRTFLNTSTHAVNQIQDIKNAWRTDNTDTSIPRLYFGDPAANTRMSNYWVEDAGYFRLSNIQLGYSVPSVKILKLTSSILSQGRLYAGCSNAATITKYTGLDPEDDTNPAPVVFYMGLTLKF